MSNAIQKFINEKFQWKIRIVEIDGEPWLVGKDVADALGYSNPRDALAKHVSDQFKRVSRIATPSGAQSMTLINEAGLYKLIMRSKLPNAEKFSDWVCGEVLPSIRKHGVYATDNFIERSIADPDWAIAILTELKKTRAERDELKDTVNVQKTQIAELQPKSDYCDIVLKCSSLVSVSVIAKDYGYSAVAFNQLLYNYGIQYKQGDIWLPYQEYAKLGWTKTKTYVYDEENNKCNTHMYWTQKGRLGLYQFLKEKGIFPLIERKESDSHVQQIFNNLPLRMGGQVNTMIENSSYSSDPDYMSKSDFDTAISAFGASQYSPSFTFSTYSFTSSYAPYNLYKLADDYVISLLPVDSDKYDYTDASKKIQLAEMAYKLTNGQLVESTNKIEPTLTYTDLNYPGVQGIDNALAYDGYSEFQISYDGDGMLACKIADGWAYIDKDNKMSVAVPSNVEGYVFIKAYEGLTYKAKIISKLYITWD